MEKWNKEEMNKKVAEINQKRKERMKRPHKVITIEKIGTTQWGVVGNVASFKHSENLSEYVEGQLCTLYMLNERMNGQLHAYVVSIYNMELITKICYSTVNANFLTKEEAQQLYRYLESKGLIHN